MINKLLEERLINHDNVENCFCIQKLELNNNIDVLGLKAHSIDIEDRQIAVGYITGDIIYFVSLAPGKTVVSLTDGQNEASIMLFVHQSGKIVTEVSPYLGRADVVPVYYQAILGQTAIAIDLKGALKDYLINHNLMNEEDDIMEVHYQSMHPNVLQDSIAGNFILGNHKDGLPLTNKQEYALANRSATLKFSKINLLQNGTKVTLSHPLTLTFMITNQLIIGESQTTKISGV